MLRECIVNLARIKEAVSIAVQKPSDFAPQGLDNVPQLLRGITAGLLMLGKGRAVELMDAIGSEVRTLIEPGAPSPDALRLERIADAIVSIEYYMETLQNGRTILGTCWIMPKRASRRSPSRLRRACPSWNSRPDGPQRPSSSMRRRRSPWSLPTLRSRRRPRRTAVPPAVTAEAPAIDPQFLELFIEEAKEEIASIRQNFPLWDQNPMDLDSLASLRRSFHTLKGSGRMVGAATIAEFSWSVENLLNRIIDKTLSRTPGMMTLLRNAVTALPNWWSSWKPAAHIRCRWNRS